MKVTVGLEHRFLRDPEGAIWTKTMFPYAYWKIYAESFGEVQVLARVQKVPEIPEGFIRADGPSVRFVPLDHYIGPKEFVRSLPKIFARTFYVVRNSDGLICRTPGTISTLMYLAAKIYRTPYAAEVIGDSRGVFGSGGVGGKARFLYLRLFSFFQKRICWESTGNAYVTRKVLQREYPQRNGLEYAVSDVKLPSVAFSEQPRDYNAHSEQLKAIIVGSLEQPYKGVDIALHAIHLLKSHKSIELLVVGDGRLRAQYHELAVTLGIADRVYFLGSLPAGDAVREQLRAAHLFLMPSRTEGMPRALLEAMAMGLPVLASRVGGIPEVVPEQYLFNVEAHRELAALLLGLPGPELAAMSARNLAVAHEFEEDQMEAAHREFLTDQRIRFQKQKEQ